MTTPQNLQDLIGRTATDNDGDKIGKIGQVYVDDDTSEGRWVTVSTGLFGTKESFAPLFGANRDGDDLRLAVSKQQVKDAPKIDADGHLSDEENDTLYDHFAAHLGGAAQPVNAGRSEAPARDNTTEFAAQGHDVSGPNTDDSMTRSEERLNVGTQTVESGRARLRKYVVTEEVTQTVPVSHEEIRVEREPISDANRGPATSGAAITEEEHEVTLHEERPVVQKETVPVERVRLGTETVAGEETVTEQVRSEQIDAPDTNNHPDR